MGHLRMAKQWWSHWNIDGIFSLGDHHRPHCRLLQWINGRLCQVSEPQQRWKPNSVVRRLVLATSRIKRLTSSGKEMLSNSGASVISFSRNSTTNSGVHFGASWVFVIVRYFLKKSAILQPSRKINKARWKELWEAESCYHIFLNFVN